MGTAVDPVWEDGLGEQEHAAQPNRLRCYYSDNGQDEPFRVSLPVTKTGPPPPKKKPSLPTLPHLCGKHLAVLDSLVQMVLLSGRTGWVTFLLGPLKDMVMRWAELRLVQLPRVSQGSPGHALPFPTRGLGWGLRVLPTSLPASHQSSVARVEERGS